MTDNMDSSTDAPQGSDACCSSGVYPFVVRDIERMHWLILEGDCVAVKEEEEEEEEEVDEEYLWFLPRADESKNDFLARAKIIGDSRRVTQDKKKSTSPMKRAQSACSGSLDVVANASSSSTASSSETTATIVRTNKYGMRSLNMGAGHYRKMIRISTTTTASSPFHPASSRSKSPDALRSTASLPSSSLPTKLRSPIPPANNPLSQPNLVLTHEQLRAQLKELMSRRYRQFLAKAGKKPDDALLDDIFLSPIDDDGCEFNSETVSDALVETDSSHPPVAASPTPSADSAAINPQTVASPISAERQRRARHSTSDQCRTCPGCRSVAPRASSLALATLSSYVAVAGLSTASVSSTTDRPTSSRAALATPSEDNSCCACCWHASVTRSYEWSDSVEICDDCALPYSNFIDDPVAAIVKWRCIDQCKQKLEQQSDAQPCEPCNYWASVDAVKDIIDQRRPPRPVVESDPIRVNRRKQSMPPSESTPKSRSEKTFVPIYESDDVKALYDSTGPRLRHVCRTSPLCKKSRSFSLSFLPLSWRRELQEEERLRYADETPVESRRLKWFKRGTKYDRSSGGSGRPVANVKSKKESLLRRSSGDAHAFDSVAKKRRRHTSGFEDDPQSCDYFYKPVTSRSASKEAAQTAGKCSSREPSVGPPPIADGDDRRRKSRSRPPHSPSDDQQPTRQRDRSDSVDRFDPLRRMSDPGYAISSTFDRSRSAEAFEPSTPPFDPTKDAMRQCTVPISPLEHKEVYIRLRLSEKERHPPDRDDKGEETTATPAERNRLSNGFALTNGGDGPIRHLVNGNDHDHSLLTELRVGDGKSMTNESMIIGDEHKLKKEARKAIRSDGTKVPPLSPSSMSVCPFPSLPRPPLSLRLSTDERGMDGDVVGVVSARTLQIEDKLAESAVPKRVELFNGDVPHYAEENERDAQRVPHPPHHHRVDPLQL